MINGQDKIVRPDIIVHNRKTGPEKVNFLVVECKKEGAPQNEIDEDQQKILALMQGEKYEYSFGLQVVYGRGGVKGKLFFKSRTSVISEPVNYSYQDITAGADDNGANGSREVM